MDAPASRIRRRAAAAIVLGAVVVWSVALHEAASSQRVRITSRPLELESGGRATPVDLAFTNPTAHAVTVRGATVRLPDLGGTGCEVSVKRGLEAEVRIPARSRRTLSGLGVPVRRWPALSLHVRDPSGAGCSGLTLELGYLADVSS